MSRPLVLLAVLLPLVALSLAHAADVTPKPNPRLSRLKVLDAAVQTPGAQSPNSSPAIPLDASLKRKVTKAPPYTSRLNDASRVLELPRSADLAVERISVSKGNRLKNYTSVSVRVVNYGMGTSTGAETGTLYFETAGGQREFLTSQTIPPTASRKAAVVNYNGSGGRSFAGGTFVFVLNKHDGTPPKITREYVD